MPQISPVRKTRKVTVETISEYVTNGHIVMYTIFFKFKTALFFEFLLAP